MLSGMAGEPMTTIKLPRHPARAGVRRRGPRRADCCRLDLRLLDERERQDRFEAVRRTYSSADSTYAGETAEWDRLAGDGLES